MSISGIGFAGSDVVSAFKQRRQQFESLMSAVKSGDVTSAQKALAALQQSSGTDSTTSSATANPRKAAFAALASAVTSGDIAGAQKALSAWQATRANAADAASGSTAAAGSSGRDKFTSDFASIFASVQSGDVSGAQQALKTLQADAVALYGPNSQAPSSSSTSTATKSGSTPSALDTDVQTLFSAVQAGDSTASKAALDKLMADTAATAVRHGHHHHHGGGAGPSAATGGVVSASDAATTATGTAASVATDADGDAH